MKKALTVALGLAVLSTPAFACSNIDKMREQFKSHYEAMKFPVQNERGNVLELAVVRNFKTSENLLEAKFESFFVGTFDIVMREKVYNMTVLANVDTGSCTLEPFNQDDVFGSSIK